MNTTPLIRLLVTGLVTGIALTSLGLSQAWADSSHREDRSYRGKSHKVTAYGAQEKRHGRKHFAKVVAVQPITQSISQRIPVEQCWTEQVRYEGQVNSYRSNTSTILGGIIGAAIGNNLGRNHHRDNRNIKTVAGGLLGAAIGRDLGARHQLGQATAYSEPVQYRSEQRCSTRYETQWQERITGYDVSYRYRGETYHTRMDYDPGDKIRVNVQVRPVL